MRASSRAIEMIKYFEGCKLKAYKPVPTERFYTIGYGHYGADVKKNQLITKGQAEALLEEDIQRFEILLNGLMIKEGVKLSQPQYDALIDFCFNLGFGSLEASTLWRLLRDGEDVEKVANQFLRWNKAGGKVLKQLTSRREAERTLFLSSAYDESQL